MRHEFGHDFWGHDFGHGFAMQTHATPAREFSYCLMNFMNFHNFVAHMLVNCCTHFREVSQILGCKPMEWIARCRECAWILERFSHPNPLHPHV